MDIKGTTVYTNEIFKRMAKFSIFKNKVFPVVIIICEIIMIISFALLWADGQWQEDAPFMSLLLFFILFIPAVLLLTPAVIVHASKKLLGLENLFVFTEDGITLTQKGQTVNGQMEVKYETMEKVYETKDCFYVFITKAQGYPLLKKDIEDGKAAELTALLREKLANKFVRKV